MSSVTFCRFICFSLFIHLFKLMAVVQHFKDDTKIETSTPVSASNSKYTPCANLLFYGTVNIMFQ